MTNQIKVTFIVAQSGNVSKQRVQGSCLLRPVAFSTSCGTNEASFLNEIQHKMPSGKSSYVHLVAGGYV